MSNELLEDKYLDYDKVGWLTIEEGEPSFDHLANYDAFRSLFEFDLTANRTDDWVKIKIKDERDGSEWTDGFGDLTSENGFTLLVPFPSILPREELLRFWFCCLIKSSLKPKSARIKNIAELKVVIKIPPETSKKLRDLYYNWLLTTKGHKDQTLVKEQLVHLMMEKWCFNCGIFGTLEKGEPYLEIGIQPSVQCLCKHCGHKQGLYDEIRSKKYPGFITMIKPKLPTFEILDGIFYGPK